MIPGITPSMATAPGPQIFYRENLGSSTATSTFNFSSVDIGFPDPTRTLVIGLNYYEFDTTAVVTSMTVGTPSGVVSIPQRVISIRAVAGGTGSFVYSALHSVTLPELSTSSINIQFNRGIDYGCEIGVWALYNVSSPIPIATVTTVGTNGVTTNLNINTRPDDLGVAIATGVYDETGSFAWSNASERYDIARTFMVRSGADFTASAVETPRITTVTPSGVNAAYCLGIWR